MLNKQVWKKKQCNWIDRNHKNIKKIILLIAMIGSSFNSVNAYRNWGATLDDCSQFLNEQVDFHSVEDAQNCINRVNGLLKDINGFCTSPAVAGTPYANARNRLRAQEEPLRNRLAEANRYIQEQQFRTQQAEQLRNPHVDFIFRAAENKLAFRQTSARTPTTTTTTTTETSPGKTCNCNVCFDDKEVAFFESLTCGHNTCNDCLTQMVDTMIREKDTASLKCPHCTRQIQENEIRKITNNDKKVLEAYSAIATEEYLNKQQNVQQCPTADCPYRFFNENYDPQIISCPSCHVTYCSKCLTNHPEKAPCNITEDINTKETQKWLDQNTKACPHCNAQIQKDGGCDYVTCEKCHIGFCFNCLESHRHIIRCENPPHRNTLDRTINNLQPQQNTAYDWVMVDRPRPVPQEIQQQMIEARGVEENRRIEERTQAERILAERMREARRLEEERTREARRSEMAQD